MNLLFIPFMQVRGGAHIVHTYWGNIYILNVGEIRVECKRSILLGVTQSWQRNKFEYSFVIFNEWSSLKYQNPFWFLLMISDMDDNGVMLIFTSHMQLHLKYFVSWYHGRKWGMPFTLSTHTLVPKNYYKMLFGWSY